jgi:hypothetical protein
MKVIKIFLNKLITFLRTFTVSGWSNEYDFYLIFGQKDLNKSPWIENNWKSDFEPFVDLLIKQSGNFKETELRVVKETKLLKLKWEENIYEKWTIDNNLEDYFLNFELWTPSWIICERKQVSPDIFISIANQRNFEKKREIKFGYFIVVSIAKSLKVDSKPILREFSEKINSKATILKTRVWNKSEKSGNWTFGDSIQDTFSNNIYKGKNLHSFDFEQLIFEPIWEVIYRQK